MFDWILLLDNVLGWVQWLTTFTILVLLCFAGLYYFINKRAMFNCIILLVVLIIVAGVLSSCGIQIVPPEIYEFFRGIF